MPNTVIGVVAHNNEDCLDACLRSLHAYTSPDAYYVFVDNGSEDATAEMFEKFLSVHDGVLIKPGENTGCNQGWNLIFKQAKLFDPNPDWLILLNSDIQVLRPAWDREMVSVLELDKTAATAEALGVLHYPGGNLQHVGSAATAYRFSTLFELWAEDEERHRQDGPWDVERFPGWEGDIDVFNALRQRGWWPGLARQGVQVLHLCGATECALRQGEEFQAYKQAARAVLVKKWPTLQYYHEWWGHRRKIGAIETVLLGTASNGHPIFADGVDEDKVRELYSWL